MRLSLLAQAWDGYEDIRYEELYIGDYDNDKYWTYRQVFPRDGLFCDLYLPSYFGCARDLLKMSALRYFYPCAVEAYYTYYTKATLPCTPSCPNYAAAVLRPQVFKTNSDPLGELHEYLPMPGQLCLTPRLRSQLVRDLIVAQ